MGIMKTLRHEIGIIVLCAVAILIVFILGLQAFGSWYDERSGYDGSFLLSDGYCNIAVIPIVGDIIAYDGANGYVGEDALITTSAGDVRATVQAAQDDPNIRGIFAPIDSYGGTPVASEVIANLFKASAMPVAALIGEAGTSGAYLAATGADIIFASPFSEIGSICLTM